MKAILVIDMPNNCYDCQYCRFDARRYNFRGCVLTDTDVQDGTIDICKEVHSCCPLKPIPKRMIEVLQIRNENIVNILNVNFANGWNACLEEIKK